MKLYRHENYDHYRAAQIEKNVRKFDRVFIVEEEVREIARRISHPVEFGLCHGVRNGWEVQAFQRALGCPDILGTEISPLAYRVPSVIVWDFHEVKLEWLGRADFIYSNSLDHSYDPQLCLSRWMSCLSPRGVCVLNWHKAIYDRVDAADCFKARRAELEAMIRRDYLLEEVVRLRGRHLLFVRRR